MCIRDSPRSGKGVETLAEALQLDRNADPLLGRLEYDKGCRCALGQRLAQVGVQDHLGVAAILEAAHELRLADILAVDIQAETIWQKHAQGCQYTQDLGVSVGGLQRDDRQANLGPVVGNDILQQRTLFGGGAGSALAYDRP